MPYSIETDRRRYFEELGAASTSGDLARAYINYSGILYNDQRDYFVHMFSQLRAHEGREPIPSGTLDGENAMSCQFLAFEYPKLRSLYFGTAGIEGLACHEILPETPNPYCDQMLPSPPSLRMMRATRAAVGLYQTGAGGSLFVFPNGYQFFRRDTGQAMSVARSRAFARNILDLPSRLIAEPVVIVQDENDGANFAHFLFDWIPRIVYFAETGLEDAKKCLFVLGGKPGPLQIALIEQVSRRYGLDPGNFYFPEDRVLLELRGPCYFFTDQKHTPLHPAHMAHPTTVQIVRETVSGITRERAQFKRLFVSRNDASLRRIVNEEAVAKRLERFGFHVVRLAEYDIRAQLALVRGAEIVVGAHGMGLTHAVAHDDESLGILEMFHPQIGSDAYIFIARALGFQHDLLFGAEVHDGRAGYIIDPDAVDARVAALIERCASASKGNLQS